MEKVIEALALEIAQMKIDIAYLKSENGVLKEEKKAMEIAISKVSEPVEDAS